MLFSSSNKNLNKIKTYVGKKQHYPTLILHCHKVLKMRSPYQKSKLTWASVPKELAKGRILLW